MGDPSYYCGLSVTGCLIDTSLQLVIFVALGIYLLQLSDLLAKHEKILVLGNSPIYQAKLVFQVFLCILEICSLYYNCITPPRYYYLIVRYSTNIIIWIVCPLLTYYEHHFLGFTTINFKVFVFITVFVVNLEQLFESMLMYEQDEEFQTLMYVYELLLILFYGLITMVSSDYTKRLLRKAKQELKNGEGNRLEQDLVIYNYEAQEPMLQKKTVSLNNKSHYQINVLKHESIKCQLIKDVFILAQQLNEKNSCIFQFEWQNQTFHKQKEMRQIFNFIDSLRQLGLGEVTYEELDKFENELLEGQQIQLVNRQKDVIQNIFDQYLFNEQTNNLLYRFLNSDSGLDELLEDLIKNKECSSLSNDSNLPVQMKEESLPQRILTRLECLIEKEGFIVESVSYVDSSEEYEIKLSKNKMSDLIMRKNIDDLQMFISLMSKQPEKNEQCLEFLRLFGQRKFEESCTAAFQVLKSLSSS